MASHAAPTAAIVPASLTPEQVRFFEVFGFLHLRGLFAEEADALSAAFDRVFAEPSNLRIETRAELHFEDPRETIGNFVDRDPTLAALRGDPRIVGVVRALMGPEAEYQDSDGNLFHCDTSWHPDIYGSPLEQFHLKVLFYLDPLREDSGALRVLPGTNHYDSTYAVQARQLLAMPKDVRANFGIDPTEVPGVTVPTDPGDVLVISFRTMHASFGGDRSRRLFTLNYRQPVASR
ncbi:MAG: phytanoyl-CoA dioxygenase family protein [Acidimicrobiales bacterium]|jgi:hypothetical protein|nr:phytanoyl-CoA dioxygenase family protein [Acidimicrobiales bacterium]